MYHCSCSDKNPKNWEDLPTAVRCQWQSSIHKGIQTKFPLASPDLFSHCELSNSVYVKIIHTQHESLQTKLMKNLVLK